MASSTSTEPGGATLCTLEAALTVSPITMPSDTLPMVIATSPVTTPARASELHAGLGTEICDGFHDVQGGPDGTLGVVLVRYRCPPDGHDGIADELLDRAPVVGDDGLGALEVEREQLSCLLGVAFLREGCEADQVDEQHRAQAALAGGQDALNWLRAGGCS